MLATEVLLFPYSSDLDADALFRPPYSYLIGATLPSATRLPITIEP